jgi:hypothetical protein
LEDLPNKVRDLLGIVVDVNLHTEGDSHYIEVVVQAYPNPISYRGHYYMRSGSTLQELKGAALDRFLLGRHGRTWDGVPLPQFSLADVSAPAMARFRQLAQRSGRLDAETLAYTSADSDAHLLDKLRLKEGAYFKRATALLFAADPQRFVTGAFVKVGFFESETELLYHDEVEGDLFHQVPEGGDLVRRHCAGGDLSGAACGAARSTAECTGAPRLCGDRARADSCVRKPLAHVEPRCAARGLDTGDAAGRAFVQPLQPGDCECFFQSGRDRGLGPWGGADFCDLRSGGYAQTCAAL